jgi:hypothetical protein
MNLWTQLPTLKNLCVLLVFVCCHQLMAEEERAEYGVGNAPANMLSIVELSSNIVHCQSGRGGPDGQSQGRWFGEQGAE